MNEISHKTANQIESGIENSTSHILVSEAYDHSTSKAPPLQSMVKQSDEVPAEKYYRLGHTEDESFRHVVQTWRHVLNGNATKLELLEFGIEAAAAAAFLRFGVKKFWPVRTLPKSPTASTIDDTILAHPLTGAEARNHPVMRAHIRTRESPTFIPR